MSDEACNGILRFAAGIELHDFNIVPSIDGQCLLIHCRQRLVAWCSAIGSSAEIFELTNRRYTLAELLDSVPAAAGSAH